MKYVENEEDRMKVIYVTLFSPVILSLISVVIYDNIPEYMAWTVYLLQFVAFMFLFTLLFLAVYDSLIKVQRRIRGKTKEEFDGKEFNEFVTRPVDNKSQTESEE